MSEPKHAADPTAAGRDAVAAPQEAGDGLALRTLAGGAAADAFAWLGRQPRADGTIRVRGRARGADAPGLLEAQCEQRARMRAHPRAEGVFEGERPQAIRLHPQAGVRELFVSGQRGGTRDPDALPAADGNAPLRKTGPVAPCSTTAPSTASVVPHATSPAWGAAAWLGRRAAQDGSAQPLSSHELHAGFRRHDNGSNQGNGGMLSTLPQPMHGQAQSRALPSQPLSTLWLQPES